MDRIGSPEVSTAILKYDAYSRRYAFLQWYMILMQLVGEIIASANVTFILRENEGNILQFSFIVFLFKKVHTCSFYIVRMYQ